MENSKRIDCFQCFSIVVVFFHRISKEIANFLCNNKVWPNFYGNSLKGHLIDVLRESNRFHPLELHKLRIICLETFPQIPSVRTFKSHFPLFSFLQFNYQAKFHQYRCRSVFFLVFDTKVYPSRLRTFSAFLQIDPTFSEFLRIFYHAKFITFEVQLKVSLL